ncbi:MAG: hypothetical protein AB9866_18085 [Syntrophobacteraceae bacterium]
MEKIEKCIRCGKEKKIIGQGLCCSCYHRERRKRLESASGTNEQAGGDFTVTVDFSPMAFLLEEMKKRAGVELRDVGRQILWELNKTVGAGAC